MIDIIVELSDEYTKSSFTKMKVDEVLQIYNKVVDEFEKEQCDSADDEVDEDVEEPNNKKTIRRLIFNDIIDNQFNKFNEYFTTITNYKIDDEIEQAVPKDGCWTNFSHTNLKIYGDINKLKYQDTEQEEIRKEILTKYNYH